MHFWFAIVLAVIWLAIGNIDVAMTFAAAGLVISALRARNGANS